MERRKLVTGMAVVALCGAVGVGGGLLGCAPQGSSSEAPSNDGGRDGGQATTSDADKTMEEWGELYPLQYGSYHQSTVKDDGLLHGHYDLKQKLLAPAKRVERTDGSLTRSSSTKAAASTKTRASWCPALSGIPENMCGW